ncbi:MAG: DMT family transporter [Nocardiopsaceae bacterium]|nr:DMT family transporter [Nocardiopsaceae bacterium]
MTTPVIVAVASALATAAGAAFQERAAIAAPASGISQARLLRHLVRSRRWLAGTLLTVCGVAAHMWALGHAPLVIIQPIGISGLLFAVVLSAFFRKRRLTTAEVVGSLAVTGALTGLLAVLPMHAGAPRLSPAELVLMPAVSIGVMLCCLVAARFAGGAARAWTLALAGGVAYGATSAFARMIGVDALRDPAALLSPLTLIALAIGLSGAVIVQNSYRTGHFALAYATLLISDPVAAGVIGVAFFGERLPADPVNASVAAAAVVVGAAGVVTLARAARPGPARLAPAQRPPWRAPRPERPARSGQDQSGTVLCASVLKAAAIRAGLSPRSYRWWT